MARSISTLTDSLNFFVQANDVAVLTVAATATSTQSGADQVNTLHKGAILNSVFTTISATCTVRLTAQGKDTLSGLYYAIASLSLDGLTTGNINTANTLHVYPAALSPATGTAVAAVLPAAFRVIASITGATTSLATVSFAVNASKVL